jgi:hypothetical protein
MKTTKCVSLGFAALFSVVLAAAPSPAARMFFSPVGPGGNPMEAGADLSPTVEVTLDPADPARANGELFVWYLPTPHDGTAATLETYTGIAYSIDESVDGIANPTAHQYVNFNNSTTGSNRWGTTINQGALNSAPTRWLNSAAASAVSGPAGIGNNAAFYAGDAGRDPVSGAFYLGRLQFTGVAPGDVGLYFRVGTQRIAAKRANTAADTGTAIQAQIMMGDSDTAVSGTVINAGDPIAADNAGADAIIHVVQAGGPTRMEVIQFEPDPNNNGPTCLFPAPSNVAPVNCVVSPAGAKVKIDAQGVQHDFFDVFFDINVDDPTVLAALAAGLTAQEADDGLMGSVEVIMNGANVMGLGIDYDLHLRYSNTQVEIASWMWTRRALRVPSSPVSPPRASSLTTSPVLSQAPGRWSPAG